MAVPESMTVLDISGRYTLVRRPPLVTSGRPHFVALPGQWNPFNDHSVDAIY
jgi:hypothetical protein